MYPTHINYCNNEGLEYQIYRNKLEVLGQGIVKVKPDMAEVVIGIITESTQLEIAQKENTMQTQKVLDNIKVMGIPPEDIQTQNYSINIKYDYIDGKQVFRGYTVSNYFNVLIRDISIVGQVIDAAVNGGANAVNNVRFIVSNISIYYNEALKLAVKDTQNKAMAIASKLKVNINMVPIQIKERGSNPISPLTTSFKASAVVTPIEAGENKIIANIEVVFIYN
jgi:uncharacterized protein